MRRFLVTFLFFAMLSIKAFAQQTFFVYLEFEEREPFYVMIDGKTNYSSSLNGFITIPQMASGVYDAEVGFVKNKYSEQHFPLVIKNEDLGYCLRKSSNNTFSLLNLFTSATIPPINAANTHQSTNNKAETSINNTATFANKLNLSPNCIIATNKDFILLHKLMETKSTEGEKIAEAQNAFAKKCFSVEEVKTLSKLISSDKNKLIFFSAARQSIYNSNNFDSLEGQLTDPNIKKQFRNTL